MGPMLILCLAETSHACPQFLAKYSTMRVISDLDKIWTCIESFLSFILGLDLKSRCPGPTIDALCHDVTGRVQRGSSSTPSYTATTMSVPQTPTRRSQRFQPTATPSSKVSDKNILQCEWAGDPIFTRTCNAELDLLAEECEKKAKRDDDDDEDDEGDEELETVFYESFKMRRKPTSYRGTKRLKVAKTELQTYRVGDTVMVETDTLYLMKKPPSIGVIVAMWETRRKGEENQECAPTMRIRIHWFLRPTEMASIRAKREHEEVSNRFYCISSTNTFYRTKYTIPCQRGSS